MAASSSSDSKSSFDSLLNQLESALHFAENTALDEKYADAETCYRKLTEKYPLNHQARLGLMFALLAQKKPEDALRAGDIFLSNPDVVHQWKCEVEEFSYWIEIDLDRKSEAEVRQKRIQERLGITFSNFDKLLTLTLAAQWFASMRIDIKNKTSIVIMKRWLARIPESSIERQFFENAWTLTFDSDATDSARKGASDWLKKMASKKKFGILQRQVGLQAWNSAKRFKRADLQKERYEAEAKTFFLQAIKNNYIPAGYDLGTLLVENGSDREGMRHITEAAKKGHPASKTMLANMLMSAGNENQKHEGLKWLLKAVESHEFLASYIFSIMLCIIFSEEIMYDIVEKQLKIKGTKIIFKIDETIAVVIFNLLSQWQKTKEFFYEYVKKGESVAVILRRSVVQHYEPAIKLDEVMKEFIARVPVIAPIDAKKEIATANGKEMAAPQPAEPKHAVKDVKTELAPAAKRVELFKKLFDKFDETKALNYIDDFALNNEYGAAEECYRIFIEKYPSNFAARLGLMFVLLAQNKPNEALNEGNLFLAQPQIVSAWKHGVDELAYWIEIDSKKIDSKKIDEADARQKKAQRDFGISFSNYDQLPPLLMARLLLARTKVDAQKLCLSDVIKKWLHPIPKTSVERQYFESFLIMHDAKTTSSEKNEAGGVLGDLAENKKFALAQIESGMNTWDAAIENELSSSTTLSLRQTAQGWFEKARNNGFIAAAHDLGTMLLTESPQKAMEYIREAAEGGYVRAKMLMAAATATGSKGQNRNIQTALDWMKKAVASDERQALFIFSVILCLIPHKRFMFYQMNHQIRVTTHDEKVIAFELTKEDFAILSEMFKEKGLIKTFFADYIKTGHSAEELLRRAKVQKYESAILFEPKMKELLAASRQKEVAANGSTAANVISNHSVHDSKSANVKHSAALDDVYSHIYETLPLSKEIQSRVHLLDLNQKKCWEILVKGFISGQGVAFYLKLKELKIFDLLFPPVGPTKDKPKSASAIQKSHRLIMHSLSMMDQKVESKTSITEADILCLLVAKEFVNYKKFLPPHRLFTAASTLMSKESFEYVLAQWKIKKSVTEEMHYKLCSAVRTGFWFLESKHTKEPSTAAANTVKPVK